MSLVIVKFMVRNTKVIWYINDWWVLVITFLLSLALGQISKKFYRKFREATKKVTVANPKGGEFIDGCIDPDGVYELLDPGVILAVRRMLEIPDKSGITVISAPVLIMAYVVSRQALNTMRILNGKIFVENVKATLTKAALGFCSGVVASACTPMLPLLGLIAGIVSVGLIANASHDVFGFDCDAIVSKVPMQQLESGKQIGFLDVVPEKSPKIYIQGREELTLYVPGPDHVCSGEYKQIQVRPNVRPTKRATQIEAKESCKGRYTPLRKRTKTLADLRREDSTDIREQAQPGIARYEKRRERRVREDYPNEL